MFGRHVPLDLLWAVTVSQTFPGDLGSFEEGWSGISQGAPPLGLA